MNNELRERKSWLKRNAIWFASLCGVVLTSAIIFFSSGMGGITTDFAQAYADIELYERALEKAQADERVTNVLGTLEPIDKLAIIEGNVDYSDDNSYVTSSISVEGTKGKAMLDIAADKVGDKWIYTTIDIRIKKPVDQMQTIQIVAENK